MFNDIFLNVLLLFKYFFAVIKTVSTGAEYRLFKTYHSLQFLYHGLKV